MRPVGEQRIFHDADALARGVADWICALAQASAGAFAVCLSGGSTPRRLYQVLAERTVAPRFPWSRARWFWGDERFVPHDHPESNYGMAREALFSRVPVPAENIHPVPTDGISPEGAATRYEATLKRCYGAEALERGRPLFDLTLLGIGEDGHTASLFPGAPALEEKSRWVRAVVGARPEPRITLTLPALASSRDLAFLATGSEKREVLARVQAGDRALPAARVRALGRLHWFTDRSATPQ